MAIAFVCPRCAKKYKAPDSVAGRKTRCKACGETITVPATDDPENDPDVYGLVNPEAAGAGTNPKRGGTVASSTTVALRPGARIDLLTVIECSTDRLVLESRHFRLILMGITGLVSLGAGLWWVSKIGTKPPNPQGAATVSMRGFFLLTLLVGYGFLATFQLARVGYRMTFEGQTSALSIRRLFFWESVWSSEDLDVVAFMVSKPNHQTEGDGNNHQYCDVFVVDRQGKAVASFGMVTQKQPADLLSLAHAAVQAAQLLDLPIYLQFRGRPMHAAMHDAVEVIRRSDRHEPDHEGSVVRKEMTVYVAAGIATGAVLVIALLKFFLL